MVPCRVPWWQGQALSTVAVLHLSLVRTVVGATLGGLWQEDSSPSSILVSQNVFGNSKTLLGSWCFFCGTV